MSEPIFLISAEEYEAYKDRIPVIPCWWWLSSMGDSLNHAMGVWCSEIEYCGDGVDVPIRAVRPAIIVRSDESEIGDRIIKCGFPWIKIAPCMAIAEVPIAWRRFDTISSDYRTSEVRQYLLDWYDERKEF